MQHTKPVALAVLPEFIYRRMAFLGDKANPNDLGRVIAWHYRYLLIRLNSVFMAVNCVGFMLDI